MEDAVLDRHDNVAALASQAERRTTPSGDGTMTWRIWGNGEPLVLLHGGMGSWMHWVRNIPELSRRFRLFVPDIPGHMDSAMPSEPYGPESVASVLLDGINRIIGPAANFSVVGFSFGAAIGGSLAWLAGARVRRLVLLSPGGLGLPRGEINGIQRWRHISEFDERRAIHRRNLQISMISDPSHIDEMALDIHMTSTEAAKPVSAPISLSDTLQGALPAVKAELAGIWGRNDPASAPFMAERVAFFHSIQPDAPIIILDEASHWAQYEAAKAFNTALIDLLDRPSWQQPAS